ncbi:A-kinase-interacting protein 1 isoform X1 [Pteropus medius]|uniref:A-kinase-interacting protein 1 isoform X1 n=1 Tax=Pteropus vampyrus TaxID=132908 RepID=UPI00196B4DF9|nr:A-kinase-interacting protein 1 isoform X1 [Pteropus giganteus]XP_039719463.1 A-kinase-interacting protein 1 isoform X1 [Pteropus giganteus]
MENYLAAAALNAVDRRSLQRSARLGQEVLERARRRAVDWHSPELPKSSVRVIAREPPYQGRRPGAGPQRLLLGEREETCPTLSASFRTMAEFMDYTSSQCGKYYSSVLEEGGATHVYRYHRGKSKLHLCSDVGNGQRKETSLGLGGIYQAAERALEASQPLPVFYTIGEPVLRGRAFASQLTCHVTKWNLLIVFTALRECFIVLIINLAKPSKKE